MVVLHLVTNSGSVFFDEEEAKKGLWVRRLARKAHLR
jgi:hypothetical protein